MINKSYLCTSYCIHVLQYKQMTFFKIGKNTNHYSIYLLHHLYLNSPITHLIQEWITLPHFIVYKYLIAYEANITKNVIRGKFFIVFGGQININQDKIQSRLKVNALLL